MTGTEQGRVHSSRDDGFVLLESVISIALITLIMTALTTFFVTTMRTTAKQRGQQAATQIATSAVETVRGIGAAGAVSGRAQNAVPAFPVSPNPVGPWLTSMTKAWDRTIAANAIATPTLPFVEPTPRTINGVPYTVSYYVGWCYRSVTDTSTSTPCVATNPGSYIEYVRTVISVTWRDRGCPAGTCSYFTAVMLNGSADPLFNFNTTPPPVPSLTGCVNQLSAVGDTIKTQVLSSTGPPAVTGICNLTGGVPGFTFTATGLPTGITMAGDGTFANSMTTGPPPTLIPLVAGTYTVNVTVTDAFIRSSTASFTWTVNPALKINNLPGPQASTNGQAITAVPTMTGSGGSGAGYVFTATGLPPGITLSAGGLFSGTPTSMGPYPNPFQVVVTLKDNGGRSITGNIAWTVGYAPPVPSNPGNQVATINQTIGSIPLSTSGGSGSYTWSGGASLPAGLSLSSDGVISGTPTATVSSKAVTLTVTDTISGKTANAAFTWTVYAAPTVAAPATKTSNAGQPVSVTANYTCANAPCLVSTPGFPGNLAVTAKSGTTSGTVTISGTVPGPAKTYPGLALVITDNSGAVASSPTFTWTVTYAALVANNPGSKSLTVGTAITPVTLTASGGSGNSANYSWAITAGALPAGLTLSPAGVISGRPSHGGTYTATATVTDSVTGTSSGVTFTWTTSFSGQFQTQLAGAYCARWVSPGLQSASCNGSSSRLFTIQTDGTVLSSGATASSGNNTCLSVTGAVLSLVTCSGAAAQQWSFPADNTIRNSGGLCLSLPSNASGVVLTMVTCGATPTVNMKWTLL